MKEEPVRPAWDEVHDKEAGVGEYTDKEEGWN